MGVSRCRLALVGLVTAVAASAAAPAAAVGLFSWSFDETAIVAAGRRDDRVMHPPPAGRDQSSALPARSRLFHPRHPS